VNSAVIAAGWSGGLLAQFGTAVGTLFADNSAMDAVLGGDLNPAYVVYTGALQLTAPCAHGRVIKDQSALNQATEALKRFLDRLAPLDAEKLLSAPVPAACDHQAGVLTNGHQTGIPAGHGDMQLSWASDPSRRNSDLVFGDLSGDGRTDAATVLACNAGGVAWPDIVALYGPGPALLGSVSLTDVRIPNSEPGENARVERLQIKNGKVEATWTTQQHGDPAAISTIDYWATFSPRGDGGLVATNVRAVNEVPTVQEFVARVRSGNRAAVGQLATPDAATNALVFFGAYPSALNATPSCYGVIDLTLPTEVQPFVAAGGVADLGGDRICLFPIQEDSGARYLAVGMFHDAFNAWHVGWVRDA
jgi:hypothetical protein